MKVVETERLSSGITIKVHDPESRRFGSDRVPKVIDESVMSYLCE